MRRFLAAPLLAGCLVGCLIEPPSSDGTYYPPPSDTGWGSGYGGSGGDVGYGCHQDSDCGGTLVCARDGECLTADSVRIIHVNWTVSGEVASDTTCVRAPELAITFGDTAGDLFGFAPVPCNAGRYTVDKLPSRMTKVELARSGEYSGGASATFDATGNAVLNLPY
ncbi:MAG TPA: hypothetical protein VLB44_25510 [Kofleriaceae bacterium]|nr:hypothetical protein [Kofleriaceae bacterium]